jgi:hypothetical protein
LSLPGGGSGSGGGDESSRLLARCSNDSGGNQGRGDLDSAGSRRSGNGSRGRGSAQRCSTVNLGYNPFGCLLGVEFEVVQVLGHNLAASTYRVASSAVGAENWGVVAETCEALPSARGILLVSAIEHVPRLIGGMHDIAPEESGSNLVESVWVRMIEDLGMLTSFASRQGAVETGRLVPA